MFQALIAGSHRGVYEILHQEARDKALRWLAQLDLPVIEVEKTVDAGLGCINYVPNNDNHLNHGKAEKGMKAKAFTKDPTLIFRWHFADNEQARVNASVICAMASLLMHLGQHQDIVYGHGEIEADDVALPKLESERDVFQPFEQKNGVWKSPAQGTFEAFQARYHGVLNGNSPLDYTIPCRTVHYEQVNILKFNAPYALFELWRPDEKRFAREPRDLRQVSGMARNAMLKWLEANPVFKKHYGEELTSQLIAGHESKNSSGAYDGAHFAFVPIPSFNKDWTADGYFRRVLVIGYDCETGKVRELFNDAVGNLNLTVRLN